MIENVKKIQKNISIFNSRVREYQMLINLRNRVKMDLEGMDEMTEQLSDNMDYMDYLRNIERRINKLETFLSTCSFEIPPVL